jgi:hypothetical protein
MTTMHDITPLPIITRGILILNKRVHVLYWKVNRLLLKVSNILRIILFVKCHGMQLRKTKHYMLTTLEKCTKHYKTMYNTIPF